jgi:hypothetical protein
MALPNPGMDFDPLDTLTAAELDDIVENVEALSAGTGLVTSAVTADKIATNSNVLAYVEGLTSGQSTTSGSYVDATAITVTFTTPASCTRVLLRASGPSSNDTATVNTFAITDGSNVVQVERPKAHSVGNVNLIDSFELSRRITVTASTSYTFKLRFKVSGGTGVINQGNVADRMTCLWVEKA